MKDQQSKLIGRFDTNASPLNKRPVITGTFALASDRVSRSFRAWSGISANGKSYLRGTHEPERLTQAIKASFASVVEGEAPPNITLKPGELVLFEAHEAEGDEKRPTWYGYARTADGYVKLSGWDRNSDKGFKLLTGTAEPYRPTDAVSDRKPAHEGPA